MENADPIRSPDELDDWYDAGLRAIGPAWMSSRYCGGTFEAGPLTEAGRRLLDAMNRRRMVLDLSHMAEEAFFEAVDRYDGPVIASHSNPRQFADGDRHLTDEMIRAIVRRGGTIGHVPFNAFLLQGWRRSAGDSKDAADLDTVVRTIDYVCQLAGSARHVAFGSDFDGGFGAEATPRGIDSGGGPAGGCGRFGQPGLQPGGPFRDNPWQLAPDAQGGSSRKRLDILPEWRRMLGH